MFSSTQRVDPQSVEFEMRLLGGLFASKRAYDAIEGMLTPADFFKPQHAVVFAAATEMHKAGQVIAKPTVAQKLRDLASVEGSHAEGYVADIAPMAASDEAMTHFAAVIREKSQLRLLVEAGRFIEGLGYDGEANARQAIADAEARIQAITDAGCTAVDLDMAKAWRETYDDLEQISNRDHAPTSEWPTVDELTSGFLPETFTIWGGGAGSGKSGAVQNHLIYKARAGNAVAIFPTELGKPLMKQRIIATLTGIPVSVQMRGKISPQGWERISEAVSYLASLPLYVFDSSVNTIPEIRRNLRAIQHRHGSVSTIVVDHVDFIQDVLKAKSAEKHIVLDQTYKALSAMRLEFKADVHAVQHVNRDGMKNMRPTLSDLKGGGNPEGVADNVILIYRPQPGAVDASLSEAEQKRAIAEANSSAEWIIAKARHGMNTAIPMRFDGARHVWSEVAA